MLSRDLEQAKIPEIFASFSALVGEDVWLEQESAINREIDVRPSLADFLLEQNRVVLALAACTSAAQRNRGRLPWSLTSDPQYLEAFVFAWRVTQLATAASQLTRKRHSIFLKRVREALRAPHMLRAMQMEATVATHFVAAGRRVLFPELGSGSETYDLLVEDLGPAGLEIECKVVTVDKGRKIHMAESKELLALLAALPCIQHAARLGKRGLAIRVTVPKRLPDRAHWEAFCDGISTAILSGCSVPTPDGTKVRLFDFDPVILGRLETPASTTTRKAIESITGAVDRHLMLFRPSDNAGGIVAVVLDSEQPDSMLYELFDTFANSAGRQLTGKRPGALFASFEGITAQQLGELGTMPAQTGEHSALEWKASDFLETTPLSHVVGVGFLSDPDYSSAESASGGTAFWIPKPVGSHWHPSFSGIFGHDPRTRLLIAPH